MKAGAKGERHMRRDTQNQNQYAKQTKVRRTQRDSTVHLAGAGSEGVPCAEGEVKAAGRR